MQLSAPQSSSDSLLPTLAASDQPAAASNGAAAEFASLFPHLASSQAPQLPASAPVANPAAGLTGEFELAGGVGAACGTPMLPLLLSPVPAPTGIAVAEDAEGVSNSPTGIVPLLFSSPRRISLTGSEIPASSVRPGFGTRPIRLANASTPPDLAGPVVAGPFGIALPMGISLGSEIAPADESVVVPATVGSTEDVPAASPLSPDGAALQAGLCPLQVIPVPAEAPVATAETNPASTTTARYQVGRTYTSGVGTAPSNSVPVRRSESNTSPVAPLAAIPPTDPMPVSNTEPAVPLRPAPAGEARLERPDAVGTNAGVASASRLPAEFPAPLAANLPPAANIPESHSQSGSAVAVDVPNSAPTSLGSGSSPTFGLPRPAEAVPLSSPSARLEMELPVEARDALPKQELPANDGLAGIAAEGIRVEAGEGRGTSDPATIGGAAGTGANETAGTFAGIELEARGSNRPRLRPTENSADRSEKSARGRETALQVSSKYFQKSPGNEVAKSMPTVGTDVATSAAPMSDPYLNSRAVPVGTAPSAVELSPAGTGGVQATKWDEAVALPESVQTAQKAVDAVLNASERFAAGERSSVNLQFAMGDANLSVRVEMRHDQVHATFQTESAELRAALVQECQTGAFVSPDRAIHFAPPVISGHSGNTDGFSASSGDTSERQRDMQDRRAASSPSGDAYWRIGTSNSGQDDDAALSAPSARVLPTSVHLHTLA